MPIQTQLLDKEFSLPELFLRLEPLKTSELEPLELDAEAAALDA